MTTGTAFRHRVLRRTPERIYRALVDPDAMVNVSLRRTGIISPAGQPGRGRYSGSMIDAA